MTDKKLVVAIIVVVLVAIAALAYFSMQPPRLAPSEGRDTAFAELEKELNNTPGLDTTELENLLKNGAG